MRTGGLVVQRGSILALVLLALTAGTACNYRLVNTARIPKFDGYQAVLFANGQVLIGKLEGLGTAFPVMRDVYAVKAVPAGDQQNPQKTTNVLVSRSKEWHAPGYTVINAAQVLVIEPVTKNSRMDQLIAEEHAKRSQ